MMARPMVVLRSRTRPQAKVSLVNIKIDALHGDKGTPLGAEAHLQVPHLEEDFSRFTWHGRHLPCAAS